MKKLNEELREIVKNFPYYQVMDHEIEGDVFVTLYDKDGVKILESGRLYLVALGLNLFDYEEFEYDDGKIFVIGPDRYVVVRLKNDEHKYAIWDFKAQGYLRKEDYSVAYFDRQKDAKEYLHKEVGYYKPIRFVNNPLNY